MKTVLICCISLILCPLGYSIDLPDDKILPVLTPEEFFAIYQVNPLVVTEEMQDVMIPFLGIVERISQDHFGRWYMRFIIHREMRGLSFYFSEEILDQLRLIHKGQTIAVVGLHIPELDGIDIAFETITLWPADKTRPMEEKYFRDLIAAASTPPQTPTPTAKPTPSPIPFHPSNNHSKRLR